MPKPYFREKKVLQSNDFLLPIVHTHAVHTVRTQILPHSFLHKHTFFCSTMKEEDLQLMHLVCSSTLRHSNASGGKATDGISFKHNANWNWIAETLGRQRSVHSIKRRWNRVLLARAKELGIWDGQPEFLSASPQTTGNEIFTLCIT